MFFNNITKMYNKYTYDVSKDTGMNLNLDCFEKVEPDNINEILDNINYNFINRQEEKEEPVRVSKTINSRFKHKK